MGKNALVSIAVIVYNGRQKRCIDEEEQHVKSILEGFDPAGTGFADDGQLWYRRKTPILSPLPGQVLSIPIRR